MFAEVKGDMCSLRQQSYSISQDWRCHSCKGGLHCCSAVGRHPPECPPSGTQGKQNMWMKGLNDTCRSIEAHATCLAYANRAMAHLKTGDAAAAEKDCSAAVQLDTTYVKAWHRRATARRMLMRRLDAITDLEQALR